MQFTRDPSKPDQRKVGDYIGTVSSQGRVTIPEEVRRLLNLHPQDKVVFRVTEDKVELSGKLPTLEELAGSFALLQPERTLKEIIHEAKVDHYAKRFTSKPQS